MVVLKRNFVVNWHMAAVGGLLVGAGSSFSVSVIASQSSNGNNFLSHPKQVRIRVK